MKKMPRLCKSLFALSVGVLLSSAAAAQWTGTTVPTTTTSSVGIGTSSPDSKLHVVNYQSGNTTNPFDNSAGPVAFKIHNLTPSKKYANIVEVYQQTINSFPALPAELKFWIDNSGHVGIKNKLRIGAKAATGAFANYALSVDGDMVAKRCVVQISDWADYVFAPDYQLAPLSDVKEYIEANRHLPNVPSEAEVKQNGVSLGDMDATLLRKVEELTLYIIQLEERLKGLEGKK